MRHLLDAPCRGEVTQIFGVNPERYARFGLPGHNGLDIAFDVGTPIYLRVAGIGDGGTAVDSLALCVKAGDHPSLGRHVVVHVADDRVWEHGYFLLYAHLEDDSCVAGIGVANGWLIGRMGSTGNSTGPHLHLGLYPCVRAYTFRTKDDWTRYIEREAGNGMKGAVDPLPYMKMAQGHEHVSPGTPPPAPVDPDLPRDGRRWLGQGFLEVQPEDPWWRGLPKAVVARFWKSVLVPALMLSPWVGGDIAQAVICPLGDRIVFLSDLCRDTADVSETPEMPAFPSVEPVPALIGQVTHLPGQTGTVSGPLHVRACGHADCGIVEVLDDGVQVEVLETADGWHRIGEGRWVHGAYVWLSPRG